MLCTQRSKPMPHAPWHSSERMRCRAGGRSGFRGVSAITRSSSRGVFTPCSSAAMYLVRVVAPRVRRVVKVGSGEGEEGAEGDWLGRVVEGGEGGEGGGRRG